MGTARDVITLKGSAAIHLVSAWDIPDRGVYKGEEVWDDIAYMPARESENFIDTITAQLSNWLETGNLQRAVMVIASISTKEVLERWNFSIETDADAVDKGVTQEKSDKEIMNDIQAIMRQIASSVTFLPNLEEPCTFDLLAYTSADSKVPPTWADSDARLIHNPQVVKLRSIDTKVHQVEALVAYKFNEEA